VKLAWAIVFFSACRAPEAIEAPADPAIELPSIEERVVAPAIGHELDDGALPSAEVEDASTPMDAATSEPPRLSITFLGVGGFSMAVGNDRVLTPPMYSNPALSTVLAGVVLSDHAAIDRFLDPADIENTKAILVGHAHYDHLIDVPYIFTKTPEAFIFGNVDMKRLLAAFAPDRSPSCPTSTVALPAVPRDRVIAVNDPANDRVDYRNCAEREGHCDGAWDGRSGEWIAVPSSRVRVRALCSAHPDQFLFFHLGVGCVDEDQCSPPTSASAWREGSTVAYLIDFLDDEERPIFRLYYQDAPTNGPVGYPHADLLAEKRIDVAMLCVGNYDQVTDQPQSTIAALNPRYVIAGHWESFFRAPDEPVQNIPFLDVDEYVRRMEGALSSDQRGFKPDPGTRFSIAIE
jgi:hypothetical protein